MSATLPPPEAQGAAVLPTSLYVGDIPTDFPQPEDALFTVFNKIGPVVSIKVCRDATTQRSLGYAYVNFQQPSDAEKAIAAINFWEILPGHPLRVMWSTRDPSQRKNAAGNVFVKNLPKSVDGRRLHELFSVFGTISSCKLSTDAAGVSRGYGFVNYEKEENATEAITRMNGMVVDGTSLQVSKFIKKADRQAEEEKVFTTIYVKNIKKEATEESVKQLFAPYGVKSIFLSSHPSFSTQYAIVEVETHEKAVAAMTELHNKPATNVTDETAKLYVAQAQDKTSLGHKASEFEGKNIYVKHLDDDVTKEELEKLFQPFGKITSSTVMTDGNGNPRGFGFVCFETKISAQAAIAAMNGKMMSSRPLYVSLAQSKEERGRLMQEQQKVLLMGENPAQRVPPQQMPMPQNFMAMGMRPPWQFMPPMGQFQPQPMLGSMPMYAMPPTRMMPPQMMQNLAMPRAQYPGMFQRQPMRPPAPQRFSSDAPPRPQGVVSLRETIASASPDVAKNMLGERLYPRVQIHAPVQAAKITGMLLELENNELIAVLEDENKLKNKVDEAVEILKAHQPTP